ncbi:hypothetical protein D3C79_783740 [compost metagenome]
MADAVEEGAQVDLGNGQATGQLRGFIQFTQVQFAKGAQLVGREFQAIPLSDVGCQVDQQLTLGGEGQGLALQRLAGGFAAELHVFELIALEAAVEAQFAV